jgi:hypothetical protein
MINSDQPFLWEDFMVVQTNKCKPDGRQCALLLLRLIEERGQRRKEKMTRVRLADMTLKHLWNRQRLTEQFLGEVQEWLLIAGWALVDAGSTFGAVKINAVANWPHVSSKRLAQEIDQVIRGKFNFDDLEHFLTIADTGTQAGDETDE